MTEDEKMRARLVIQNVRSAANWALSEIARFELMQFGIECASCKATVMPANFCGPCGAELPPQGPRRPDGGN